MDIKAKNEATIVKLFRAFGDRDAAAMVECYHPEATFQDPVFGTLSRTDLETMWRMLCERGKDLKITLERHSVNDSTGKAEWVALYTFSATGRPVRNVVTSQFEFKQGLVFTQKDSFDFWKWTRMALGVSGQLLGWTPLVQNSVRRKALESLDRYNPRS